MPELPDLEVIREFLDSRLSGVAISAVEVRRPLVVRNLLGGELAHHLLSQRFAGANRRGKFLLLPLEGGASLVINPMLAGRLRYGDPLAKHRKRDVLMLGLVDGHELRYHDAKDMGKIYLTTDLNQVPTFAELGPDALDPDLTLKVFGQRLRRHHGEIKGILTNQKFVAGIGNAYADEICWRAGLYPFRRRPSLNDQEQETLFQAMRDELSKAIGETVDVSGYTLDYQDYVYQQTEDGGNKVLNQAVVDVYRNGRLVTTVLPERNLHSNVEGAVSEVALRSNLKEDLYVVLSGMEADGLAAFQVIVNPMVIWLWIGGGVLILGTLVAAWPSRTRRRVA